MVDTMEELEDDEEVEITAKTAKLPQVEKAVIVAGHPRSGTSVTCRLVETCDDIEVMTDSPGNDNNPDGYYEHTKTVRLSGQWLQGDKNDWKVKQANAVLTDMNSRKLTPAFKLIHLPAWYFWRHLIEEMIVIGIFRKPKHSIKSGWQQRLFTFPWDWVSNNNTLIGIIEDAENSCLIQHERLMTEPESVADMIQNKVGIDVDPGVIDSDKHTVRDSNIYTYEAHEEIYSTLSEMEEAQY